MNISLIINISMDRLTVFEKLGGDSNIDKIIELFYDKVLKDNILKHFFVDKKMDFQKKHMINFIRVATGGIDNYTGRTLRSP